jgi:protein subunit release factor A
MLDKLEKIFLRYEEIKTLLSDPSVASDRLKSRDLGKELRSLE